MKTRTFLNPSDAVRYGHLCQQGGHDVALVLGPRRIYVCPLADAYKHVGERAQVEFFWANEERNDVSGGMDD